MVDFYYLPVELKSRELLGKLLLASELLSKGAPVLIGNRVTSEHISFSGRKACVLSKSAADWDNKQIAGFSDSNHQVYSMDEEGLLMASLKTFAQTRFTNENVSVSKGLICWGEAQRRELQSHYPECAEKFVVMGNPRAELWHNKNYGIYDGLVASLRSEYGDYILLASTFPVSSPFKKETVLSRLDKLGLVRSEQDKKDVEAVQLKLVRMRDAFAKVVEDFTSGSKIRVVIRPHPSEDAGYWEQRFKGVPSVTINSEHSISPWALGAKAVLHNSCTTAIEAGLYGVPVISYSPKGETHHYDANLGNMASHCSIEHNEVISLLKQAEDGELLPKALPPELSEYMMSPDGATSRIAEYLYSGEGFGSIKPPRKNHISLLKGWVRWLQLRLDRWQVKSAPNQVKYAARKFPFTHKGEIENALKSICSRRFPSLKVKVVKVDTNLFYLIPR